MNTRVGLFIISMDHILLVYSVVILETPCQVLLWSLLDTLLISLLK